MKNIIWDAWGLFCGAVLLSSIFLEMGTMFEVALGGGSAWIIAEIITKYAFLGADE